MDLAIDLIETIEEIVDRRLDRVVAGELGFLAGQFRQLLQDVADLVYRIIGFFHVAFRERVLDRDAERIQFRDRVGIRLVMLVVVAMLVMIVAMFTHFVVIVITVMVVVRLLACRRGRWRLRTWPIAAKNQQAAAKQNIEIAGR